MSISAAAMMSPWPCAKPVSPPAWLSGMGVSWISEANLATPAITISQPHLGTKPFIVYSGDILTDVDLAPLIDEHFRSGNDVTLALRETGLATGVALRNGSVVDIGNKFGHPGDYDFANISIWNPEILQRIPAAKKISFIPVLTEWIRQDGKIGGVILNDHHWFNIGSRT